MSFRKLDYHRVTCDHSGCPEAFNFAAEDADHTRQVLHANQWWMDERGDIVHDEISGGDFVGYKTLCPAHREHR